MTGDDLHSRVTTNRFVIYRTGQTFAAATALEGASEVVFDFAHNAIEAAEQLDQAYEWRVAQVVLTARVVDAWPVSPNTEAAS